MPRPPETGDAPRAAVRWPTLGWAEPGQAPQGPGAPAQSRTKRCTPARCGRGRQQVPVRRRRRGRAERPAQPPPPQRPSRSPGPRSTRPAPGSPAAGARRGGGGRGLRGGLWAAARVAWPAGARRRRGRRPPVPARLQLLRPVVGPAVCPAWRPQALRGATTSEQPPPVSPPRPVCTYPSLRRACGGVQTPSRQDTPYCAGGNGAVCAALCSVRCTPEQSAAGLCSLSVCCLSPSRYRGAVNGWR